MSGRLASPAARQHPDRPVLTRPFPANPRPDVSLLRPLPPVVLLTALFASPAPAAGGIQPEIQLEPQPELRPGFYAPEPELRACLESAVAENPALLATRARYQAARQRVPQVTSLPDPTLNLSQALRRVETRVGSQTGGVTVTQALPWFGTRELRGRVAHSEADAAFRLHQAEEREVIARAKEAFYELAYLDAALRLAEEEHSLLGHYEALARGRYSTGQGLQQAVLRLQAELTRILDRQRQLDRQRRTLAARLNTLCGRPPQHPVPPIAAVERPEIHPDRERLLDLAERNRQELLAAASLVEAGEGALELAGQDFRPRFTASLALMNVAGRDPADAFGPLPPDEGKNSVSVSLGVSLPVWKDKYRAGVEEAGHRLTAERRRLDAARDAMENAVEQALIRLEALDEQIELLDAVLLPQSEESLRATEAAYETGQVGVLELLDSERIQLDVQRIRARYLSDFLVALNDLERGVGAPVPLGGRRSP